jgi:hypothetical protein
MRNLPTSPNLLRKPEIPAEEISRSLPPSQLVLTRPFRLGPSPDRLLDCDRAHRAGPGARAVAHLCHDPHELIDGKGAEGVAAGVERRVPIESRVDAVHLPAHQSCRCMAAALLSSNKSSPAPSPRPGPLPFPPSLPHSPLTRPRSHSPHSPTARRSTLDARRADPRRT